MTAAAVDLKVEPIEPDLKLIDRLGQQHPDWCENRYGELDPDGCASGDSEFWVIHSCGAVESPAIGLDRQPVAIGLDLCQVLWAGSNDLTTHVEVVLPGRHADLNRAQLRGLIARLQHLDSLWDL